MRAISTAPIIVEKIAKKARSLSTVRRPGIILPMERDGKPRTKTHSLVQSSSGALRSPKWLGSGATTEMPLPVTRKEVAARPLARPLESCSDRRQPVGNAHADQGPLFLAASR